MQLFVFSSSELLEDAINAALTDIFKNDKRFDEDHLMFQQVSASLYLS